MTGRMKVCDGRLFSCWYKLQINKQIYILNFVLEKKTIEKKNDKTPYNSSEIMAAVREEGEANGWADKWMHECCTYIPTYVDFAKRYFENFCVISEVKIVAIFQCSASWRKVRTGHISRTVRRRKTQRLLHKNSKISCNQKKKY